MQALDTINVDNDSGDDDESAEDDDDVMEEERSRWGGSLPTEWKKEDAESVYRALGAYGYGLNTWEDFKAKLTLSKTYDLGEIHRMSWAILLSTLVDCSSDEVEADRKKKEKAKKRFEEDTENKKNDGGMLAGLSPQAMSEPDDDAEEAEKEKAFAEIWASVSWWCKQSLHDAVAYAKENVPRDRSIVDNLGHKHAEKQETLTPDAINTKFAASVWPSLRGRGWTCDVDNETGKRQYCYQGVKVRGGN